jgi:hypothetical protein
LCMTFYGRFLRCKTPSSCESETLELSRKSASQFRPRLARTNKSLHSAQNRRWFSKTSRSILSSSPSSTSASMDCHSRQQAKRL